MTALVVLAAGIAAAGLLVPPALAQGGQVELPAWPQFQGDAGHSGVAGPGAPNPPYREAWSFQNPEGGRGLSAPAIVGDRAVAVGAEGVYAVDLSTGEGASLASRDGGPLAAPAVGAIGGRNVVVFTEGADADSSAAVAIDAGSGEELWRAGLEDVSRSGVTIDGGLAFVGDDGGELYAISLKDEAIAWKLPGEGEIFAPPAAGGGRVVAALVDETTFRVRIVAVDEEQSGEPEPAWTYEPGIAGASMSAPVLTSEGTVLVGVTDSSFAALDAADGSVLWTSRVHGDFSRVVAPVGGDVVLVLDTNGGLYRLDPGSGEQLWSYQLNALALRGSPVLIGTTAVLGLEDGRLIAVDTDSARLVWESASGEGAVGPIAAAPGALVASRAGSEGGLVSFASDAEGKLTSIASPTVADYPRMLGALVIAFALALGFLFGGARLVSARFGPFEAAAPLVEEEPDE